MNIFLNECVILLCLFCWFNCNLNDEDIPFLTLPFCGLGRQHLHTRRLTCRVSDTPPLSRKFSLRGESSQLTRCGWLRACWRWATPLSTFRCPARHSAVWWRTAGLPWNRATSGNRLNNVFFWITAICEYAIAYVLNIGVGFNNYGI